MGFVVLFSSPRTVAFYTGLWSPQCFVAVAGARGGRPCTFLVVGLTWEPCRSHGSASQEHLDDCFYLWPPPPHGFTGGRIRGVQKGPSWTLLEGEFPLTYTRITPFGLRETNCGSHGIIHPRSVATTAACLIGCVQQHSRLRSHSFPCAVDCCHRQFQRTFIVVVCIRVRFVLSAGPFLVRTMSLDSGAVLPTLLPPGDSLRGCPGHGAYSSSSFRAYPSSSGVALHLGWGSALQASWPRAFIAYSPGRHRLCLPFWVLPIFICGLLILGALSIGRATSTRRCLAWDRFDVLQRRGRLGDSLSSGYCHV